MSAIYLLIGVSLPIALAFLLIFLRASRSGQFDDTHTPPMRMLHDDEPPVG
ncbi:MAG: cbb3-type cytochrome oxidase assembly protein CcoS [Flavobacteriales bacterium]|nr:cbb3-type cytochrome oxidase assembly protein CcoS [Flavobacteriales bacterium]